MSKLTTSSDIGTCLSESEKLDINSNDIESIFIKNTEYRKVKHAHWKPILYGKWEGGKCSVCGEHALFWMMSSGYYASPYCPNCGARMSQDNATSYTECVVNLYSETKLRFVLDECIEDEELIEKILKALDGDVE